MSTPPAPARPPGRPRSDEVTERFLTAGARLAVTRGPHRVTADLLAAAAQAGKAGFYRRWPDVERFLVDMLRYQFRSTVELTDGGTLAEDLAAVVDRHVNGTTGAVCAVLAGWAPFSAPLAAAWGGTGGPRDFLFLDVEGVVRRRGLGGGYGSPIGELVHELDQLVAWLRAVRLGNGLDEIAPDTIAHHVQARLAGRLVAA